MNNDALALDNGAEASLASVLLLATTLVVQFPTCFWFWRPDARLESTDDVRLVVQNLRKFGNREAWMAAQHLDQCLSATFKKPS